jgi:hypothetical protein
MNKNKKENYLCKSKSNHLYKKKKRLSKIEKLE